MFVVTNLWSRLTAPTTTYEKGLIKTDKQGEAAKSVARLESYVSSVGSSLARIDETDQDKNIGRRESVYGTVGFGRGSATGSCEFKDGKVQSMDVVTQEDKDRLQVRTSGGKQTIHQVTTSYEQPSRCDAGCKIETHEWAIFHGDKVTYRKYETKGNV